jgi:hypothetical protein
MIKLCKDCANYKKHLFSKPTCEAPELKTIDLVTGKMEHILFKRCEDLRQSERTDQHNSIPYCGKSGNWFKPKKEQFKQTPPPPIPQVNSSLEQRLQALEKHFLAEKQ